ncbi:MAG: thiamine pyrophosphate-requiring protein, partial [Planctomycetaceae bacterium]|nr:thiamine pyrophosphate-requiring protein [Planctomycetaceae bacterium]
MAKTAADILFDRLIDWGVEVVFGFPGDGINGFMEALRTRKDRIRFVQVRHEEGAAFMACGYAKFTGRLGVCLATSGPGAIHLLNGLYDAKMDSAPVLAITGQTYHDLLGMRYQQEVNLLQLFEDVSVFNQQVMGPEHAHPLVDAACRAALGSKGVAHVNCCNDWQEKSDGELSPMNVPGHTSSAWRPPIVVPQEESLKSAAALLNAGKKTVLLVGQGAMGAGDEVEQVAERLAAPVVKALLGKAVLPDDSPYTTGGLGLLGTLPSEKAMEECDSLLIVGSSFPYMSYLPEPGQATAVQIDRDATRLGLRYPIDIGLAGDAKATLRALAPMLQRRADRSFLEAAQGRMKEWWDLMREREQRDDTPLKPQVIARHVNDLLAPHAIVTTDSGTITTWAARHILMKRGMQFSCSGNLATMAPGLPYANAAQIAYPDRQVVAFVGDGGFTMLGCEFITAVKYHLPIKVVVIKNNTLGQIKWEQMVFLGNPEYGVELQPIDFVKFAEACGG